MRSLQTSHLHDAAAHSVLATLTELLLYSTHQVHCNVTLSLVLVETEYIVLPESCTSQSHLRMRIYCDGRGSFQGNVCSAIGLLPKVQPDRRACS